MTAWEMYWASTLDGLIVFNVSVGTLCLVCALGETCARREIQYRLFAIGFLFVLIAILVPSTQTVMKMHGIEQTQTGGEE